MLRKYAINRESVPKTKKVEKVWQNFSKGAKSCERVTKAEKVWESVLKPEKV